MSELTDNEKQELVDRYLSDEMTEKEAEDFFLLCAKIPELIKEVQYGQLLRESLKLQREEILQTIRKKGTSETLIDKESEVQKDNNTDSEYITILARIIKENQARQRKLKRECFMRSKKRMRKREIIKSTMFRYRMQKDKPKNYLRLIENLLELETTESKFRKKPYSKNRSLQLNHEHINLLKLIEEGHSIEEIAKIKGTDIASINKTSKEILDKLY